MPPVENNTAQPMQESTVSPYFSAGVEGVKGIIGNLLAEWRANRQRKWNEKMLDKQNEFSLNMWNMTNEYNDPKNQLARLTNAGLNPLYYGLDGSSANSFESAQALGYERPSDTIGLGNPVEAFNQQRLVDKQIELMNKQKDDIQSQIDKRDEERKGLILDNEFKDRIMEDRVQAQRLSNDLTKEQIGQIEDHRKQILAEIENIKARTNNEIQREGLILAEKWLKNAQAKQIAELLPFQKSLMEAQTSAQRAAAAASWAHTAYEMKLISAGYIDKMCNELVARTKNEEAIAGINQFKSDVMNGNVFDTSNVLTSVPAKLLNGLFYDLNVIAQTLTGGLSGILK